MMCPSRFYGLDHEILLEPATLGALIVWWKGWMAIGNRKRKVRFMDFS